MSKTSAMSDEDFPDHEFERSVHKAMRLCGWLLPNTEDEVRQAETELASEPVELPESLRDPFRILDRLSSATSHEQPSPPPSGQDELQIPSALFELSTDFGLTIPQVTSLMAMHAQIIANRSATRNDAPTYDDWKRLYESVKEFLQ
jgi:hypothetical protein